MQQQTRLFRKGAVGALMDEYERAVLELKEILEPVSGDTYREVMDSQTADENCRSIQTVMSHVVGSGYSYADYLRKCFATPSGRPEKRQLSREELVAQLDTMMEYTVQILEGRWETTEDEMMSTVMRTRWAVTYDMEQLLEHAIVHVLRHRRQIQKFLLKSGGRSAG